MSEFFDDEDEKDKKSSEFAKLLEDSFRKPLRTLSVGDKVRGEILVLGKEDVFVSTGAMQDGVVPRKELLDSEGKLNYKVGDLIDLFVTQIRGSDIFLSPKPTAKNISDSLEDAFDKMISVEGRVTEICKGGFRVNLKGKVAFCPLSQMDLKRIEIPEDYIGKRFEFLITQFSEGGRNVVVSRRKHLEEQKGLSESAFLEDRKEGELLKGTVTRIEKYGAFIELESGIEGLAHISELSWSRVNDPQEVVQVGQVVPVKILRSEEKDGRLKISLSLKQAQVEPWQNLPPQIKEGQMAEGKVTRCLKFGAFVELAPGIEGLIPLSEMSYTKRVMRSDELVKEGEPVSVMVKEIRLQEHRILLSLKDAGSDPWGIVPHKFPVGSIVKGKVDRREPYGLFIQLDEGVIGLLPKSKAMENSQFPYERLKAGEEIVVQINEVKLDERRISLGAPQDPGQNDWKDYKPESTGSFGTLGDKFKQFSEKKSKEKS